MKIIGIDPGTIKMGICLISGTPKQPIFDSHVFEPKKKAPINERFALVVMHASRQIYYGWPELVVCEYPFAIQGHAKVNIEVFGALRYYCLSKHIPFLPLSQSRIKKYATGNGGAEKAAMVLQAYKEYNAEMTEDAADAFWIAHVGMTYLHGSNIKHRQESINDIKKKLKGGAL